MDILQNIQSPQDIRNLSVGEMDKLCEELRGKIIETVSKNGGHLSSNLGVVELTVALHKQFDLPQDRIVWDVGHQCYCHKLLTGRAAKFDTLRKSGGVSGFPSPKESEYDTFVMGHSSTSISAALGMAKANTLAGNENYVVAVIGDGAITGGLAYEGLCNAGRENDRLIVVLNDNRMSINRNVGFVARHLASLRARPRYIKTKTDISNVLEAIPLVGQPTRRLLTLGKVQLKQAMYHSSSVFEEMGYYYLGPVDGHNLNDLLSALQTAKNLNRPVLLHVETIKGKGYSHALENPDVYHGVSGFQLETGKTTRGGRTFSQVAGESLCALAKDDEKLCVVTAAMTDGTGLSTFAKQYPNRFFDVGIAEEHAVTFASGMATNGLSPVFAVYSTFLQRAYDQLLNDTAIMNNHIVLAIDRAGLVPDDGETHQGLFDVPFLSTIPNTTVFAPSTFEELFLHLKQAVYDTKGIAAVRYPKGGEFPALAMYQPTDKPFTHFRNQHARTLVITYGRLFSNVLQAVRQLRDDIPLSVMKLNRIHPLPKEVFKLIEQYQRVVFFEEGAREGGVAAQLGAKLMERKYRGTYEFHTIDSFVPACTVEEGLSHFGLDVDGMVQTLHKTEDPKNVK